MNNDKSVNIKIELDIYYISIYSIDYFIHPTLGQNRIAKIKSQWTLMSHSTREEFIFKFGVMERLKNGFYVDHNVFLRCVRIYDLYLHC